MDLRKIGWEVVGRMNLDRYQWRELVNIVMKLGFHKRWEIS
jgi:hypothetical protein